MGVLTLAWALDQDVPAPAKTVLLVLANYTNDETLECWPSTATLSKKTSMSARTVRRHLADLEERFLVERIEQRRQDGSQTSNRYRMIVDFGKWVNEQLGRQPAPEAALEAAPEDPPRSDLTAPPVTSDRPPGQQRQPMNRHKNTTEKGSPIGDPKDAVREVFTYWLETMPHRNGATKLTDGRATKIRARFADGYTVEQLKRAVDGCASSEFHQGKNDQNRQYDDLTLICRSGEKVEEFMQLAGRAQPGSHLRVNRDQWKDRFGGREEPPSTPRPQQQTLG